MYDTYDNKNVNAIEKKNSVEGIVKPWIQAS